MVKRRYLEVVFVTRETSLKRNYTHITTSFIFFMDDELEACVVRMFVIDHERVRYRCENAGT